MADKSETSIPWAGIAMVVALASTTLLVQRSFEPLRPPEKERDQQVSAGVPQLEVDARLWEDPFVAVRRYEDERIKHYRRLKDLAETVPGSKSGLPKAPPDPEEWCRLLGRNRDGDLSDVLVIAALVAGNPFVGGEENRRRTRYAMVAGLQAKGYVPDQVERIGLMQLRFGASTSGGLCPSSAASAVSAGSARMPQAPLIVPYELFSERPFLRGDDAKNRDGRRYKHVALLWIDESELEAPRLDSLARVFQHLFADLANPPRLAVIGPSSSDALRIALKDLKQAASRLCSPETTIPGSPAAGKGSLTVAEADRVDPAGCRPHDRDNPTLDAETMRGYRYLARAQILNAAATAPTIQLQELNGQRLENFLNDKLLAFLPRSLPLPEIDYKRLMTTDNEIVKRLVTELQLRLPASSPRRVVVVAERDSLYAQALVAELKYRMRDDTDLTFDVRYFFRGLDGVTTREGVERPPADRSPAAGKPLAARPDQGSISEWPEARDQLDYLRRIANSLRDSEGERESARRARETQRSRECEAVQGSVAGSREGECESAHGPIGAIGILASDVHDKLLVLQALHESFPDKVFFTTDMDSRYLHARTQAFTRNLIVVSSLPLEFNGPIQAGTPPMRDVYQSAAYLAARQAVCRDDKCEKQEKEGRAAIADPSVYEIGRHRAVPLAGHDFRTQPPADATQRAIVAVLLAGLLAGATLVYPSTPALNSVRARVFGASTRTTAVDTGRPDTAFIVALHVALLIYTVGSLIEFAWPASLSVYGLLLVACTGATAVLLLLYPRSRVNKMPPAGASKDTTTGDGAFHASASLSHADAGARPRATTDAMIGIGIFLLIVGYVVWATWPDRVPALCSACEPVAWLEGVSAWPSHLIHLAALVVIVWALDHLWASVIRSTKSDTQWLGFDRRSNSRRRSTGFYDACHQWLTNNTLVVWPRDPHKHVDFTNLWECLLSRNHVTSRVGRIVFWYGITLTSAILLFVGFSDGYVTEIPVRGVEHRRLIAWTLYAVLALLPLLVVAVADATMLECRFMGMLDRARTAYPPDVVARFARTFGADLEALWTERFVAEPGERSILPPDPGNAVHTLLDDWLDVQLVARRTRIVARMVMGPFLALALLVVARSRLFDNWALTLPVGLIAAAYLLWLIAMASLLKVMAERLRRRALDRMNADLSWLAGSKPETGWPRMTEPFRRLIEDVKGEHGGAFASIFEQPLFKAILVPLGSAGGAQLFDRFLIGP